MPFFFPLVFSFRSAISLFEVNFVERLRRVLLPQFRGLLLVCYILVMTLTSTNVCHLMRFASFFPRKISKWNRLWAKCHIEGRSRNKNSYKCAYVRYSTTLRMRNRIDYGQRIDSFFPVLLLQNIIAKYGFNATPT